MKTYLITLLLLLTLCTANAQIQLGADIDGEAAGDISGYSVSISSNGNRIAIGAPYNNGNGFAAGLVRVYEWTGSNWVQLGNDIDGEAAADESGSSISLSSDGRRIAIGAPYNYWNGTSVGHTRIYEWNGRSWVQMGTDIYGEAAYDFSGWSVSTSSDGNRLAIGAPGDDGNGSDAGQVRIYEWNGSNWLQLGNDIDGEAAADESGSSISLSSDGNRVAIGAPYNCDNGTDAGHTRVYEWTGSSWIQLGVDIDGEAAEDLSGYTVSLSAYGNRLAVGAFENDGNGTNAGHVRVYEWTGSNWIQLSIDIDGEAAGDWSGASLSLSSDGSRLAIGAPYNDGNGNAAGHVRLYDWTGSDWIQLGPDLDGEAINNLSGWSVSLSSDGYRVTIGTPYNDSNGTDAGHVRVYSLRGVFGSIYNDINENCLRNTAEAGLRGRRAIITPGNYTVETNQDGTWLIDSLPIGTYTITADTSGKWRRTCPVSQSFTVLDPNVFTQAPAFGFVSAEPCPAPSVSIQMPFMRPCFSSQKIYVSAINRQIATGVLSNAYVDVQLDTLLIPQSASIAYTDLGNNTWRFLLGDINPGQTKNFNINCQVSCSAVLGQTLCMQANLFPADSCVFDTIPTPPPPGGGTVNPCTTPWDKSSLSVNGYCQNDSIYFTITNTGSPSNGNMTCYTPVRIYIDGIFFMLDSIQLNGGETAIFAFAGDGRTWRLEADQHPLHPGNPHPNATVEACGDVANWTAGLVNILPPNDADPIVDIYCGVVTGSYDPNDKTGYPTGISTQHYIMPNQQLQYVVRFQNTGTDTAFTVIIRDTLDSDLDIFSVVAGVSSHNCTFKMYGPRILEWTFNNILLPDSNHNQTASHGFVSYTVNQNPNSSNGTIIRNAAAIYFDFNEPVITNETWHQVNDMTVVYSSSPQNILKDKTSEIKIYPNPAASELFIELAETFNYTGKAIANYQLISFDGRTIKNGKLSNNKSKISTNNIENGIYILEVTSSEKKYFNKVIVAK